MWREAPKERSINLMSKRSKKAAKTPPEPTAAPVGVLLARLPRSSLESLLTEAVKSGAVPLERIRQALPEAKHTLVIAKPKVSGGPTRPDAATTVRSLRIASGDKHASLAPDVLKKTLSHFKNLTSLDLGGKKATAAVFTLAAKQPWAASTLESFTYRECGATPFDTVGLLGQATHLTSLSMTCDGVHIPPPHPTPPHPHSSP